MTTRSSRYPQVRAEWREVEWSAAKREKFAALVMRLIEPHEGDEPSS
ncbi:hypothetical protein OG824_13405 [Streptomyces prunicolor]|nr:hypothetical protein [Streptomyces prunicolor]MCX5236199.1 hypothetical protein [Streptomyces prunicolor]